MYMCARFVMNIDIIVLLSTLVQQTLSLKHMLPPVHSPSLNRSNSSSGRGRNTNCWDVVGSFNITVQNNARFRKRIVAISLK